MHPDDYHEGKVREIMGFLIGAERPPEDFVLGRPSSFISEYAFDSIDDRMHDKVHQAKPPQGRSEYHGNQYRADSMYRRVCEQRAIAFLTWFAFGQRHPVCLQQKVAGEMLQPEQRIKKGECKRIHGKGETDIMKLNKYLIIIPALPPRSKGIIEHGG